MKAADGFTLLEVLVATAVLALSITVLLGLFSLGLRNQAQSRAHDRAGRMAIALADRVLLGGQPASPWNREDGFSVRWVLVPADESAADSADEGASSTGWKRPLDTLAIQVEWPSGGRKKGLVVRTFAPAPKEGVP